MGGDKLIKHTKKKEHSSDSKQMLRNAKRGSGHKCLICSSYFKLNSDLALHMKQIHEAKKEHQKDKIIEFSPSLFQNATLNTDQKASSEMVQQCEMCQRQKLVKNAKSFPYCKKCLAYLTSDKDYYKLRGQISDNSVNKPKPDESSRSKVSDPKGAEKEEPSLPVNDISAVTSSNFLDSINTKRKSDHGNLNQDTEFTGCKISEGTKLKPANDTARNRNVQELKFSHISFHMVKVDGGYDFPKNPAQVSGNLPKSKKRKSMKDVSKTKHKSFVSTRQHDLPSSTEVTKSIIEKRPEVKKLVDIELSKSHSVINGSLEEKNSLLNSHPCTLLYPEENLSLSKKTRQKKFSEKSKSSKGFVITTRQQKLKSLEAPNTLLTSDKNVIMESVTNTDTMESESSLIVIDNLINSLPDPDCGILLQSHAKNDSLFKCAKCGKQLRGPKVASDHYASCRYSKPNKGLVSLNDVRWVCNFCHSLFNEMPQLSKHMEVERKTVTQIKKSSSNRITTLKDCTYICPRCQYKCWNLSMFQNHNCKKNLKPCSVLLEKLPLSEDCSDDLILYYQCPFKKCKKVFFEEGFLLDHQKSQHNGETYLNIRPFKLNINKSIHTTTIKNELIPMENQYLDSCTAMPSTVASRSQINSQNQQLNNVFRDCTRPYFNCLSKLGVPPNFVRIKKEPQDEPACTENQSPESVTQRFVQALQAPASNTVLTPPATPESSNAEAHSPHHEFGCVLDGKVTHSQMLKKLPLANILNANQDKAITVDSRKFSEESPFAIPLHTEVDNVPIKSPLPIIPDYSDLLNFSQVSPRNAESSELDETSGISPKLPVNSGSSDTTNETFNFQEMETSNNNRTYSSPDFLQENEVPTEDSANGVEETSLPEKSGKLSPPKQSVIDGQCIIERNVTANNVPPEIALKCSMETSDSPTLAKIRYTWDLFEDISLLDGFVFVHSKNVEIAEDQQYTCATCLQSFDMASFFDHVHSSHERKHKDIVVLCIEK